MEYLFYIFPHNVESMQSEISSHDVTKAGRYIIMVEFEFSSKTSTSQSSWQMLLNLQDLFSSPSLNMLNDIFLSMPYGSQ